MNDYAKDLDVKEIGRRFKPEVDGGAAAFTDSNDRLHKGVLKIDATCADA